MGTQSANAGTQARYQVRDDWSEYVYAQSNDFDDIKTRLIMAELNHNDADLGVVDTHTGRFVTVVF